MFEVLDDPNPLNLSEMPTRERHRLLDLAANIKDAWMTIMGGEKLPDGTLFTPSDRRLLEMANFLIEKDAVDKYEDKYLDLRYAVNKALDTTDDEGRKLRDYSFSHAGPIVTLKKVLMDAVGAVNTEEPNLL